MDFPIILKEALKEKEKAWKTSRLTAVLEHMFTQFDRYTLPEKEEMFLSVFEDGNK